LSFVKNGFITGTLLCDPGGITKSPFVTNLKGALQCEVEECQGTITL